ncbi:hypothetical protein BZL29_7193 [Mycobacterium kansasii]|uniref:Uncharacterized protein n=1 Tax=Mycobacterium kansasii TaxID=1768 RepID=A0A1V3WJC5_MYCKA|nr:hypothetical protein BZL29_7193 [Mycobacterium kansasii]
MNTATGGIEIRDEEAIDRALPSWPRPPRRPNRGYSTRSVTPT